MFKHDVEIDKICKRLYSEHNDSTDSAWNKFTVMDDQQFKWILNSTSLFSVGKVASKRKRTDNEKTHFISSHPTTRHFIEYIVHTSIIPEINKLFAVPDGLIGVKQLQFVIDDADTKSGRSEDLLTLSGRDNGDYTFIIALSNDIPDGDIQLFDTSAAAVDSTAEEEDADSEDNQFTEDSVSPSTTESPAGTVASRKNTGAYMDVFAMSTHTLILRAFQTFPPDMCR